MKQKQKSNLGLLKRLMKLVFKSPRKYSLPKLIQEKIEQ